MSLRIRNLAAAREEFAAAVRWYEQQPTTVAPRPKRHKCGSGTNGPAQFVSLLVGVAATWGAALSWRGAPAAAVTACPGLNGTPVVDIFVNFVYCFIAGLVCTMRHSMSNSCTCYFWTSSDASWTRDTVS